MMASIQVRASISAARAPFIVPFTASANCWLVAMAKYRGMLAAEVAACSAALQADSKSPLALATAVWDSADESWSLKMMNINERIGYASHVRERMCGN